MAAACLSCDVMVSVTFIMFSVLEVQLSLMKFRNGPGFPHFLSGGQCLIESRLLKVAVRLKKASGPGGRTGKEKRGSSSRLHLVLRQNQSEKEQSGSIDVHHMLLF